MVASVVGNTSQILAIFQLFLHAVGLLGTYWICKQLFPQINLNIKIEKKTLVYVATSAVIAYFMATILGAVLPGGPQKVAQEFSESPKMLLAITAIVFAPISEEIIFRHLPFQINNEGKGDWLLLIVTSIIFGSVHYQDGYDLATTVKPIIVTSFIGLSFGLLYIKTRSLFGNILAHSIYNFTVIFILVFVP